MGTVILTSLFELIIHNWSLSNDLADSNANNAAVLCLNKSLKSADSNSVLAPLKGSDKLKQAVSDLRKLIEQVRDTPGLGKYFNGISDVPDKANTISFDYLWIIFPPGELVLSRIFMGQLQAFVIKESKDYIYERRRSNDKSWAVECWAYDWNEPGRPSPIGVEDFRGTRSISSLQCYFLKYHRDGLDEDSIKGLNRSQGVRETLVRRGKGYRELCIKNRGKQIFESNEFALSRGTGVRMKVKITNTVSVMRNENDFKNMTALQDDDPDGWSLSGRISSISQPDPTQAKKEVVI